MNKSKEDQIQIQRKRKRVQCETKPDDDDDKILKSNAKPGLISCDENEHQLSQNWYSGVAEMSHLVQRKRDEHSNASTFVSGGSAEKSKKGCYADSAVDLGCIKEEVVDLTDIPVCSNKEIELEESDIVKEEPIEENQDSTLIEEHGNTLFVRLNIPDTEVAPTELRGKEDGVISANVIEINVAKEESDDEFDTETQMEIKDEPLESENQDFTKGEGVGPLKEANVSKDNSITPALDVQEERLSTILPTETAAERKRRLAREQKRRIRASLSQEQLEARREYDRQRYKNQSLDVREARLSQARSRHAQTLLNEPEDKAALRRERARQRRREKLLNETEEEAAARRADLRARASQRRRNETEEEAARRRADLRERASRRLRDESEEEAVWRRARKRQLAAEALRKETEEQANRRRESMRLRMQQRYQNETEEERNCRRQRNADRLRAVRSEQKVRKGVDD